MVPTYDEMYAALAARHGEELQSRLSQARVAVCGLGGLGSNVAIHLARAGVGRLLLIDFDRVDISNLNRQQYYPEQIGLKKSEAMKANVLKIAPYCQIEALDIRLGNENIVELLGGVPIICECFDDPDAKAELVNCVLSRLKEAKLVAASGMAGLGSANKITTRRPLAGRENFYLCGDGESDAFDNSNSIGLVSARVAVCAAHQATMVIRLISGQTEP